MASPDETVARTDADLPPALSSMVRLLRLGHRYEPRLLVVSLGIALLAAVPDALFAVWLKLLSDGITEGDDTQLRIGAVGLAASAVLTWFLDVVSSRTQRRFRDRLTISLEGHVADLQATIPTIAHQERPELLDRLSVLRNQIFVLDHMFGAVFTTAGWILRVVITIVLLMSIDPALGLLAVAALPTVLTSSWRPAVERDAEERGAPAKRLSMHLFGLATTAPPGKEVRVTGIGPELADRRRASWEEWYGPVARARTGSAVWHALGWLVFGLGYVAAVVYVASGLEAPAGDVLLVLAAGARLSSFIGSTVGEIGFLRGVWLDGSRRLAWLEDYAASFAIVEEAPVPERLEHGITLEDVSFAYPGTERLVLEHVSLTLPAGGVVAVVGENGAGKSTLVKLLAKLYEPTAGRILIDGAPLAAMPAPEWRDRLAGAFQDFFRFELPVQHSVGVGDVPRVDDEPAVTVAVDRAGAEDVVTLLPDGLGTQLGPTWPGGVEVSFGQWQKLAVARGFMRDDPLLLVLDEPTAALDAETEHALFERYAAGASAGDEIGRITLLVSHRFSTVRMADLIVVLDGAHVVEVGTHAELMAQAGQYAELYGLQAAAYR